jgi:hypothetical protein
MVHYSQYHYLAAMLNIEGFKKPVKKQAPTQPVKRPFDKDVKTPPIKIVKKPR